MMRFDFIKHSELDEFNLDKIVKLKNQAWPHPYSSHIDWIHNNIMNDDVHLLLWDGESLVGYLNLVELKGSINGWGIGNVVVAPERQGQNLGMLLMNICDYYLVRSGVPGMLICKDKVLDFYKRCGWSVFDKEVYINDDKLAFNFMTRRFDNESANHIKINRLF